MNLPVVGLEYRACMYSSSRRGFARIVGLKSRSPHRAQDFLRIEGPWYTT